MQALILNTSGRESRRLTTPSLRLGRAPTVATWLVAGAAVGGVVAAADIGASAHLPAVGDGLAK